MCLHEEAPVLKNPQFVKINPKPPLKRGVGRYIGP